MNKKTLAVIIMAVLVIGVVAFVAINGGNPDAVMSCADCEGAGCEVCGDTGNLCGNAGNLCGNADIITETILSEELASVDQGFRPYGNAVCSKKTLLFNFFISFTIT